MDSLLPYLLTYPNAEDPLNREAAALLQENAEAYTRKVLEATKRHSMR
jgi:ubiquitin-protein ligase